jgi:hypothetical protein
MAKGKKISIVFEETGMQPSGDMGFNVYLEGMDRDLNKVPEDKRTAAEFWATRCFQIVASVLQQTGAARTAPTKPSVQ